MRAVAAAVGLDRSRAHTRLMADRATGIVPVSLDPSPVIEAYKKDVDRTLLRENLKLTPDERLRKMISVLAFVDEVRRAGQVADK